MEEEEPHRRPTIIHRHKRKKDAQFYHKTINKPRTEFRSSIIVPTLTPNHRLSDTFWKRNNNKFHEFQTRSPPITYFHRTWICKTDSCSVQLYYIIIIIFFFSLSRFQQRNRLWMLLLLWLDFLRMGSSRSPVKSRSNKKKMMDCYKILCRNQFLVSPISSRTGKISSWSHLII